MKFSRPILIVLLSSIATNAFATCESERRALADWNSRCEQLSAASQLSGAAGGIFAIVTYGASLIPCAAAIAAAKNACRIKDEKQDHLKSCELNRTQLSHQDQNIAQLELKAKEARQSRIIEINTDFEIRRTQLNQHYEQLIQSFVNSCKSEGWDLDDPNTQELIRTTKDGLENERTQTLELLEADRQKEISNA